MVLWEMRRGVIAVDSSREVSGNRKRSENGGVSGLRQAEDAQNVAVGISAGEAVAVVRVLSVGVPGLPQDTHASLSRKEAEQKVKGSLMARIPF